jgi:hypothetical protein
VTVIIYREQLSNNYGVNRSRRSGFRTVLRGVARRPGDAGVRPITYR